MNTQLKWEKMNQSTPHLNLTICLTLVCCVHLWRWSVGRGGTEHVTETPSESVSGPAAQQICLFCTIWHQTQQTAEWLLLRVVPH